jgi:hypothetical protein
MVHSWATNVDDPTVMPPGASFNLEAVKAQLEKARAAHGQ